MKKLSLLLAAFGFALFAVIAIRTASLPNAGPDVAPLWADADDTARAMAGRLSHVVQIETVSFGEGRASALAPYDDVVASLQQFYPRAFASMRAERVGASLILHWKSDGAAGAPAAFLAHMDVVPIEPGTEDQWTHPPFSGAIADGAVWGRGAMDNKGPLIALMEAAERLAASGFSPRRDIYFLFGHDEELGGGEGAAKIAERLKSRGVRFSFTLDEGSGLVDGVIPGADRAVALIAAAEKGSATLRFRAAAAGGHSSAPDRDTAVSLVARAVVAVTNAPYPLVIDRHVEAFLTALAPLLPLTERAALANLWLTGPYVKARLGASPLVAASMRTTTAPTIIEGGIKSNVLPQTAEAIVNYRIHPRDSVARVLDRARRLVDDPRIEIELMEGSEPSPQSALDSSAYKALAETVADIFGAAPIAPSLTLQGTDTRNYVGLADDHYRFTPFIFTPADLARIHGTDERLLISDLVRAAAYYEALIDRVAG